MTKHKITISTTTNPNGSCSIWINNAGLYPNIFNIIARIVNEITDGDELYFGHYKKDGINISNSMFKQYGMDILSFFKTYGQYYPIVETYLKKKKVCTRQELTVCSAPNNKATYKIFEKIFHYYLETIVFSPKIDWNTFVDSYSDYMNIVTNDYVLNGYTDFMFSYVDSGDFSITFNPKQHDSKAVQERIYKIIFE